MQIKQHFFSGLRGRNMVNTHDPLTGNCNTLLGQA